MSRILQSGKKTLVRILSGDASVKLNGLYVIYSNTGKTPSGEPSHSFFEQLAKSGDAGYARVHVTTTSVEQNNSVGFHGLMTPKDMIGAPLTANTKIMSVVLAYMPDEKSVNDIFVYESQMATSTPVHADCYISVGIRMTIGD